MRYDVSPALERAAEAAARGSTERGARTIRLVDWLLALIEDDESRPAERLVQLGVALLELRATLEGFPDDVFPAPADHALFNATRRNAIRLRGDPALTTELVLYTILAHDPLFAERLRIDLATLEGLLRSELMDAPTPAAPVPPAVPITAPAPHVIAVPAPDSAADPLRIIDVNLNRSREALRILDDYTRFVRNDKALTEAFKGLRHRLAEATNRLPNSHLLRSRDTLGDVGTTVTAAGEYTRCSPAQVAAVNCKRLQEALRSLEEFGKLVSVEFAREVERLRYETYTFERALFGGNAKRDQLAAARLYVLLTGSQCVNGMERTLKEAAAGGAGVFQLREKDLPDRQLLDRAKRMREWCDSVGGVLIMNDRPEIAKLAGADGVHLGQDDLSVADARRIVGPELLVGVSTHTIEQVRQAVLDGADYIGVGPTFASSTKSFRDLAGLEFVTAAFAETSLPAFALGGITPETIGQAVRAGASRVAVSACIAKADEPRQVAARLMTAFNKP